MSLLSASDQALVREMFESMINPVKVVLFTDSRPDSACHFCDDTKEIVDEVASLSSKITVEIYDVASDPEMASLYGVNRTPSIAIVQVSADDTVTDFGLRFYGIPSGYEFSTLIEDIVMVSKGEASVSPSTRAWLSSLTKPVHLQVFVTPTCPYCPQMVSLAHKLAVASPNVRADGIEATEFPELAEKYGVLGVPRTIISTKEGKDQHIEGAVAEAQLLAALQKVIGNKIVAARH